MVNHCSVVGCSNRVGKKERLSFYRFPLGDKDRCNRWVAAVCHVDWKPSVHSRICNEHFITGKLHEVAISTSDNHCAVQENQIVDQDIRTTFQASFVTRNII